MGESMPSNSFCLSVEILCASDQTKWMQLLPIPATLQRPVVLQDVLRDVCILSGDATPLFLFHRIIER